MERRLRNHLRPSPRFPGQSPSFTVACQSHGANLLFSAHQPKPDTTELSAFRIEAPGKLKLINTLTLSDLEESLIQIVLDHTNRYLVIASYRSNKVFSFSVAAGGHLSNPISHFELSDHGPNHPPGGAEFKPELIHNRSGAGSTILAVDLNKDGAMDIVTSTNRGTFIFWGKQKHPAPRKK